MSSATATSNNNNNNNNHPSTPPRRNNNNQRESFHTPPISSSIPNIIRRSEDDTDDNNTPTKPFLNNNTTTTIKCPTHIHHLLLTEASYDIHSPHNTPKRQNYLSWDDFFMSIASLSAQRSKDPTRDRVGACIVHSSNKTVVGIGYNGFPRGCSDDVLPWGEEEEGEVLHTKGVFMVHAEVNAILNKGCADVRDAIMYVTKFPCNECAKIIIQSGIRKVIYLHDRDPDSDESRASRILFQLAGVEYQQYTPTRKKITLDFGDFHYPNDENSTPSATPLTTTPPTNDINPTARHLLLHYASYDIHSPHNTLKRQNYLSWDDYFTSIAFLTAQRSKDPNTQVGACIVDASNRIVALGYNGFPRGCGDDFLPWSRRGKKDNDDSSSSLLQTKYPYVCHAEVNAIMNKCSADVMGCRIYVALFPCNDCAKVIIQSGIREVVYVSDVYRETEQCRASRIMFGLAGVKLRWYRPKERRIVIDFGLEEEEEEEDDDGEKKGDGI